MALKVNKRDRIPVKKELMPYKMMIPLPRTNYELEFKYNAAADMFTVGLYKNGGLICTEPLIYGVQLFERFYQPEVFPALRIIPNDSSLRSKSVNWNNFNSTVFLEIFNKAGD